MVDPTVSINFCGGCNPAIDRGNVALEIKSSLAAKGYRVTFNSWDADFVVRLSGCTANCALKYYPEERPDATIAGATFDALTTKEELLPVLAVSAVEMHFKHHGRDSK